MNSHHIAFIQALYGPDAIVQSEVSNAKFTDEVRASRLAHWWGEKQCHASACHGSASSAESHGGCPCYVAMQQLSGWLGCRERGQIQTHTAISVGLSCFRHAGFGHAEHGHAEPILLTVQVRMVLADLVRLPLVVDSLVSNYAKAKGVSYNYMAYSRPDVYYVHPIPSPIHFAMRSDRDMLYSAGTTNNAISDFMIVGPYHQVMTFLATFRFLQEGSILPGPHGFMAKAMKVPSTKENSGSSLENLVSTNLRLLHGFNVNCLNPEQPGHYPGFCPEFQWSGPLALTFLHARIKSDGSAMSKCKDTGVPETAPFCKLHGTGIGWLGWM